MYNGNKQEDKNNTTFEINSKQSQVDIKNIKVPVKQNENKK